MADLDYDGYDDGPAYGADPSNGGLGGCAEALPEDPLFWAFDDPIGTQALGPDNEVWGGVAGPMWDPPPVPEVVDQPLAGWTGFSPDPYAAWNDPAWFDLPEVPDPLFPPDQFVPMDSGPAGAIPPGFVSTGLLDFDGDGLDDWQQGLQEVFASTPLTDFTGGVDQTIPAIPSIDFSDPSSFLGSDTLAVMNEVNGVHSYLGDTLTWAQGLGAEQGFAVPANDTLGVMAMVNGHMDAMTDALHGDFTATNRIAGWIPFLSGQVSAGEQWHATMSQVRFPGEGLVDDLEFQNRILNEQWLAGVEQRLWQSEGAVWAAQRFLASGS